MIFRISRSCALEAPRGPKMSPRRPKMVRRGLQGGPRWPHEGSKRAQAGPKRAPRGPKMAPRGLQEGPSWPQDGSKRAQDGQLGSESPPGRSRDPPRPLRGAISGPILSHKRTPGGQNRSQNYAFPVGGSEATAPRFWLPAALLRGHYVGTRRTRLGRKRPSRAPDKLWI